MLFLIAGALFLSENGDRIWEKDVTFARRFSERGFRVGKVGGGFGFGVEGF